MSVLEFIYQRNGDVEIFLVSEMGCGEGTMLESGAYMKREDCTDYWPLIDVT